MTKTTDRIGWTSIEDLCERTFGQQPCPPHLALLKNTENERPEVKDFIERAFRLMALSNTPPANISPGLAWILGVMIPRMLPGAWGDVVPPFTYEDRHKLIDEYLRANSWGEFPQSTVLLEMGCGFPPQTALDAARSFPQWQVIGADLQFDPYVLHDAEGNYACMDSGGGVRYFQAGTANGSSFVSLYQDRSYTVQRFRALFTALREKLPAAKDEECVSAVHEGARLVHQPIRSYERSNLKLLQAGIGTEMPQADILRVFNVLLYFDSEFRTRTEEWALRTLRPGGLFLCGADGAQTLEARYSVYRNEDGHLIPKEFAFSLDNVRPYTVVTWFCLHDHEKETYALAEMIGALRSDKDFGLAYDSRLDELLAEQRIWRREDTGFLAAPPDQLASSAWLPAYLAIQKQLEQEGFADRALSVLKRAGYRAWKNPVGHIAVDPKTIASF